MLKIIVSYYCFWISFFSLTTNLNVSAHKFQVIEE